MDQQEIFEGDESKEFEPATNTLRELPYTTKAFIAAGHTYYVEDHLSIERYKAFQKMEIELGFGYNFSGLHEKVQTAFQKQNEGKFAEVSVILYQIMEGAVSMSEKKPIALYVSTLFINRADEDRSAWSRTTAEEKMKDWGGSESEPGISSNFFFVLAASRCSNFKKAMVSISQILESVGAMAVPTENDQLPLVDD